MKSVKCNACGAPQSKTENEKCIYCGNILGDDEFNSSLTDDFVLIKFEYINENYVKAQQLAEEYLKKDIFNIPCWAYKIASDFLTKQFRALPNNKSIELIPDVKKLEKSLRNLLELGILNSLSQQFLENIIFHCINKKLIPKDTKKFVKYDFNVSNNDEFWLDCKNLITFLKSEFSESFQINILASTNKYLSISYENLKEDLESNYEEGRSLSVALLSLQLHSSPAGFYKNRDNFFKIWVGCLNPLNDNSKTYIDLFFEMEYIRYKYYYFKEMCEYEFNTFSSTINRIRSENDLHRETTSFGVKKSIYNNFERDIKTIKNRWISFIDEIPVEFDTDTIFLKNFLDGEIKKFENYMESVAPYYKEADRKAKILIDEKERSLKPSTGLIKKDACFIATATLGDINHPDVIDLRKFRDEWLLKQTWGIKFTKWYYVYGSKAATIIEKSFFLKKVSYYILVKPTHIISRLFLKK